MNEQNSQQPQQPWHGQPPGYGPSAPQGWRPGMPPTPPVKKKNWFVRHKILTGLIAILLLGGFATAVSGGGGSNSSSDDSSSASEPVANSSDAGSSDASGASSAPSASTTKAAPAAPKGPGIGTPVRDGKFEFTVTKVRTGVASVGDSSFGTKAQGQFVLITVTVKNIGDVPQSMFDSNQKVTDNQGRQFAPSSEAAIYMGDDNIIFKEINPGNQLTGVLVYDMPKGAVPVSIELHDSAFSGGTKVALK
ncbi:DUF4352 domain-containing protein [Calidifontibacter sp. DB0510]|uniref:DUF4352 domain-containing protein n=1 Tax=Metallococcus carri TaxID=1656884 RepID=A0A967B4B3_9MICO|nr:DUF4352 domain-containing protein [Metallococcus carri]NHN57110.1 DUF4352 domain-containing protein [Metallococcus carri]NOP39021.1 DUF4352 domain-containing protein [Calidifontibacter sp. DB2511S]